MARPTSAGELDAVALETALLEQWEARKMPSKPPLNPAEAGLRSSSLKALLPPTVNPASTTLSLGPTRTSSAAGRPWRGFLVERKGGWDTHGLPG